MNSVKKLLICTLSVLIGLAVITCSMYIPNLLEQHYVNSLGNDIQQKKPIILVDAGHGGVDGGAIAPSDMTVEKNLNLSIALKVRDLFLMMGYGVIMTRETDISIHDDSASTIRQKKVSDLKNRLKMLDFGEAEMLVSIHMNIFSQSKYSGTQVFYGAKNDESRLLAEAVQNSIKTHIQPQNDRVIKPSTKSIYLLYNANKPAIMTECGFLSNIDELNKLKNNTYQQTMAFGIVCGVNDYKFKNTN